MIKNLLKKSICLILSAVFVLVPCMSVHAGNGDGVTDSTVQAYEQQIADIKKKQEEALNKLYAAQNDKTSATSELHAIDEVIKYNNELANLAQAQLNTIANDIEKTNADIDALNALIEEQTAAMHERMKQIYMNETTDYIELILHSSSLSEFLTAVDKVTAILDYDTRLIKQLGENRATLEQKNKRLEAEQATVLLRVAEFEAAIKEQQELYDKKLDYIEKLKNDEAAFMREYQYNLSIEKELNAQLEEYLQKLWEQSQNQYVGGAIGWPLEKGVWYFVSSEYGWRKLFGMDDFHLGIDLACAGGTPVRAANAGTVIISQMHASYGEYILIDHGGGKSTLYAHLALGQRLVQAGDYVEPGQVIGYVGLTGTTTGYHLHFETRINGKTDNPRNHLTFP
ncbi:MAG: peptidoglycan DD-metalloendopeptidase family protein [Clostridia bacterium]|nr:peptidoglycan DD-metalloendopeptidase family protein [Clostridia bacterium]